MLRPLACVRALVAYSKGVNQLGLGSADSTGKAAGADC
jgi:hypothetical protein